MKKILLITSLFISLYSTAQTTRQVLGLYPSGIKGKIYTDTIRQLPYLANYMFNGFGGFQKFDSTARLAISLTTTGSSGASTYDAATGVLNIPQYSGEADSLYFWSLTGNSGVSKKFGLKTNNSLRFYTNNIERMTIDSLGNLTIVNPTSTSLVKIGTAVGGYTPIGDESMLFQRNPTRSNVAITLSTGSATSGICSIRLTDNATSQGFINYDNGGDFLYFGAGGNERMRMNSTGVGIGVTSISSRLHLPPGTASANASPLKFSPGLRLATKEAGTIEYVNEQDILLQYDGLMMQSTRRPFTPPAMTTSQRDSIYRPINASLTITNGGSGYGVGAGVTVSYSTPTGSVPASNLVTILTSGGVITSIQITNTGQWNGGAYSTNPPTVTISGGTGTGATATATLLPIPPGATIFCTDCTATDASTGVLQTYSSGSWRNHY